LWKKGDVIRLDRETEIQVLNPYNGMIYNNLNDASIVLRLIYKGKSFLLTGDIGSDVEEMLINLNTPIMANVMKIPHHGSKHSSSLPFLLAVKPDIAVLTVGKGIVNLPSNEAMTRYKTLSIPILRTDRDGFISICTDGKAMYYRTYRR